jgi:hypothetical protein
MNYVRTLEREQKAKQRQELREQEVKRLEAEYLEESRKLKEERFLIAAPLEWSSKESIDDNSEQIAKSNVKTGIVKAPGAPDLPANKLDADKDGLKQKRQEYEVLRIIRDELKLDPLNLPYRKPGKRGSKAEVRAHLKIPGELFQSDGTFESAWERLRASDQLQGGK